MNSLISGVIAGLTQFMGVFANSQSGHITSTMLITTGAAFLIHSGKAIQNVFGSLIEKGDNPKKLDDIPNMVKKVEDSIPQSTNPVVNTIETVAKDAVDVAVKSTPIGMVAEAAVDGVEAIVEDTTGIKL